MPADFSVLTWREEAAILQREIIRDWLRTILTLGAFLTTLSALTLQEQELEERTHRAPLDRLKRFFPPTSPT